MEKSSVPLPYALKVIGSIDKVPFSSIRPTMSPQNTIHSSNPSFILTTPLNFFASLYLIPFNLKWRSSSATFEVISSKPQRVINALVQGANLCVQFYVVVARYLLFLDNSVQQGPAFTIPRGIALLTINALLIWITWTCQESFLKLANELSQLKISTGRNVRFFKLLALFLCVSPMISNLMSFIPQYYDKTLAEEPLIQETGLILTCLKYGVGALFFIAHLRESILEAFGLTMFVCLTFPVNRFCEEMHELGIDKVDEAIKLANSIREFINFGNDKLHLGSLMMLSFLDTLMSYAKPSADLLLSTNLLQVINEGWGITFFFLQTSVFWILAGEINRKVTPLRK